MSATPTPTPWKVRAGHFCDDGIPAYEIVMNGEPTINAVDARLIETAVNHHEEAVTLLRGLTYLAPSNAISLRDPRFEAWHRLLDNARQLLARLDGAERERGAIEGER